MKATEIRALSAQDLNKKLADLKTELFNLRFQHAVNQLDNPLRLVEVTFFLLVYLKNHLIFLKPGSTAA